jgi:hypothetical protein
MSNMSKFWPSMSELVYILKFLVNGEPRSVLLRPVDAANGVILDDPEDNGIMRGVTLGGCTIKIPFTHILMVERPFRVSTFNGQTTRSERCTEKEVQERIERNTDPDTGEVKNIRSIEDTRDPDNRVTRLTDMK